MPYKRRTPPLYTATLCVHMQLSRREMLERYADKNRLSLSEAGRALMEAGAETLGVLEVA